MSRSQGIDPTRIAAAIESLTPAGRRFLPGYANKGGSTDV